MSYFEYGLHLVPTLRRSLSINIYTVYNGKH